MPRKRIRKSMRKSMRKRIKKSSRKSRRKSRRKPGKFRRKSRRKSSKKSRRKSRRKSRKKSSKKSRRKSRRKSKRSENSRKKSTKRKTVDEAPLWHFETVPIITYKANVEYPSWQKFIASKPDKSLIFSLLHWNWEPKAKYEKKNGEKEYIYLNFLMKYPDDNDSVIFTYKIVVEREDEPKVREFIKKMYERLTTLIPK